MSRVMHAAIPAAIIAGIFAFALPGQSLAQCSPSNGDCEAGQLQMATAKTCLEQMAGVKAGSAGGRDHKQADRYAKTAEDYDRQADKWDELAENALTPHLEHAYRNEARGLRALADAEREKSMVHVVAADALFADCGQQQQVATLNELDEAGPEQSSGPAQAIQAEQPAQATTAAKKQPVKAAKKTKKKVVVRKRGRGKRVRVVRRSRPRVVIGVGIGFGGIGIGF